MQLGGQLLPAAGRPGRRKIQWLLDSLCFRCRQAGVELRTGCAPTLKELGRLSPMPFGCHRRVPGIPAAIQGGESAGLHAGGHHRRPGHPGGERGGGGLGDDRPGDRGTPLGPGAEQCCPGAGGRPPGWPLGFRAQPQG